MDIYHPDVEKKKRKPKSFVLRFSQKIFFLEAARGDMEIVEILLSEGADLSLKNDLGQDAAALCKSFPELRGMLEKRERKMKLRGTVKKERIVEILGKRIIK